MREEHNTTSMVLLTAMLSYHVTDLLMTVLWLAGWLA